MSSACELNFKIDYNDQLISLCRDFTKRAYVNGQFNNLKPNTLYYITKDLNSISDNEQDFFVMRFQNSEYHKYGENFDYYGFGGSALLPMLPNWHDVVKILTDNSVELMEHRPVVVMSNRLIPVHRDGWWPEPPGHENRRAGINYLLFDDSDYQMAAWNMPDDGDLTKLGKTKPNTIWNYSKNSMNMLETCVPHGTYLDPSVITPNEYCPRAVITLNPRGPYLELRNKLLTYLIKDW